MRGFRVLHPSNNEFQVSVILILIVCSLSVAAVFAVAFLWSVKTGQFDDPDANAVRILIDHTDLKKSDITSSSKQL